MMKYLLSSLIVMLLVLMSCEKADENAIPEGEDYGCIERVYVKVNDHAISSADVATADYLFSKNKVNNSILRYTQYKHDTIRELSALRDRKQVWADQYSKGLRIFNAGRLFTFYNDTLPEPTLEERTMGPYSPFPDSTPKLSLPRVRRLFEYHLARSIPTDSNSVIINYSDTCFMAEFGYYKEIVHSYQNYRFYKVWRVYKKNGGRPVAYYDDETGRQLSFSK